MAQPVIQVEHLSKEYILGQIGTGTLRGDLQSLMARIRHQEDPNRKLWAEAPQAKNGRFLAMDDVSFDVMPGEALGVIGHNGAGKSTLLKLISRITAPTAGEIRIKGRISSLLEIGTGFHPELTGMENIYLNGAIMGLRKREIDQRVDQIVDFSEIEQFIDTPVKRYSSGMYVKLAFAVGAFLDSDILICDEVLAVGDLAFQKKCIARMSEMAHSGKTVLYVSHNMRTIRSLCSRALVLEHGRLTYDGDPAEAIDRYAAPMLVLERNADTIHRGKNRGHALRFLHVKLIHGSVQYTTDEDLVFDFTLLSHLTVPDLHFRIVVNLLGEKPIATAVPEQTMSVEAETTSVHRVRMPLKRFAKGRYVLTLSVFSVAAGRPGYYDTIYDVFAFEVTDDAAAARTGLPTTAADGAFYLDDIEAQLESE